MELTPERQRDYCLRATGQSLQRPEEPGAVQQRFGTDACAGSGWHLDD